jgi:hypothetical protein
LLRCLFSHIDFSAEGSKTSSSKDFHQIQLLFQECVALLTKPTLISNLCYALDNPLHHQKVWFVGNVFVCISGFLTTDVFQFPCPFPSFLDNYSKLLFSAPSLFLYSITFFGLSLITFLVVAITILSIPP